MNKLEIISTRQKIETKTKIDRVIFFSKRGKKPRIMDLLVTEGLVALYAEKLLLDHLEFLNDS